MRKRMIDALVKKAAEMDIAQFLTDAVDADA
jgi:ribosomal protein S3AE